MKNTLSKVDENRVLEDVTNQQQNNNHTPPKNNAQDENVAPTYPEEDYYKMSTGNTPNKDLHLSEHNEIDKEIIQVVRENYWAGHHSDKKSEKDENGNYVPFENVKDSLELFGNSKEEGDSQDIDQLSPISNKDEESSDKNNNSSLDKIPQRESDIANVKHSPKIKSKKKNKVIKNIVDNEKPNINVNLINMNGMSTNTKSNSKRTTKTITTVESHSGLANSGYMQMFANQNINKILGQDTFKIMKELGRQLKGKENKLKKSKRSSSKKKKISKKSPGKRHNHHCILPKLNKNRKHSKSPVFCNIQNLNKKLEAKRVMLDKLRQKRNSLQDTYSYKPYKSSQSRKRSPGFKKSPFKKMKKRMNAKSPKVIIPAAIELKKSNLPRDKSVAILLRINIR